MQKYACTEHRNLDEPCENYWFRVENWEFIVALGRQTGAQFELGTDTHTEWELSNLLVRANAKAVVVDLWSLAQTASIGFIA